MNLASRRAAFFSPTVGARGEPPADEPPADQVRGNVPLAERLTGGMGGSAPPGPASRFSG